VRFEVDIDGEPREVDVGPDGPDWRVAIDGRVWHASMARAGNRWSLLLSQAGGAPRAAHSYDVVFEPPDASGWRVHVDGVAITAALRTAADRLRRHRAEGTADGRIVAPMPGRVVKVLVAPGAAVEARQGVVVVEAMKMENELRAPRAGVVREVRVAEGASVDAGTVLVVID
jgi:biotin carboxyl carrier protein